MSLGSSLALQQAPTRAHERSSRSAWDRVRVRVRARVRIRISVRLAVTVRERGRLRVLWLGC